jgi:hypothetical protein
MVSLVYIVRRVVYIGDIDFIFCFFFLLWCFLYNICVSKQQEVKPKTIKQYGEYVISGGVEYVAW